LDLSVVKNGEKFPGVVARKPQGRKKKNEAEERAHHEDVGSKNLLRGKKP